MKIAEEYYNNSGECINIPNSDCGCCDTIREFYKKAEEWYNNIMKKLAPDEEEPEVTYGSLKVSIRQENLGNILVTEGSGIDSIVGYGKNVLANLPVGTVINIKAIPIGGYDFDYWLVNGVKKAIGSTLEHTIKEGTNNIVANFKRSDVDTNEYFWFGAAADYNDIFTNTYKHLINNTVNIPTMSVQDGEYLWIICNENWNFISCRNNGVNDTQFQLIKTVNGNKIYRSDKLNENTYNTITINFNRYEK